MSKNRNCLGLKRQTGLTLLDNMIAMLIVLITGLGSAYAINNHIIQQSAHDLSSEAIIRIREYVATNGGISGVCSSSSFTIKVGASTAPRSVAVTTSCTLQTLTIGTGTNAQTVTSRQATFTTAVNQALFGQSGTVTVTL